MASIAEFLGGDHDRCDELFFVAEAGVEKGDWDAAMTAFNQFRYALEHHLTIEEQVLFPAMCASFDNARGPTSVMRSEHQQMRQIVQDLGAAMAKRDAEEFLGNSETLNIMVQQHNFKEEHMLYAMADQILAGQCEAIINAMEGVSELA